jgi:hypothetical protein
MRNGCPHKNENILSIFVKPFQIFVPLVKTSILEGIKKSDLFPTGISTEVDTNIVGSWRLMHVAPFKFDSSLTLHAEVDILFFKSGIMQTDKVHSAHGAHHSTAWINNTL